MSQSTFTRKPVLECLVLGHYDLGFDFHENLQRSRGLSSGEYRLYSRKVNPQTGKRRNLGTFSSRAAAEQHEREVQFFKRH